MTYSYVNGNKENPKYVCDMCEYGRDIGTFTENLLKLIYPDTMFTLIEVYEGKQDDPVTTIKGRLVFAGKDKDNSFSLSYRCEGDKVIVDKYEINDL